MGHKVRLVSFPDYSTHIGERLARALAGEREYSADVMQLLYVANRYEWRAALQQMLDDGLVRRLRSLYLRRASRMARRLGSMLAGSTEIQRFCRALDDVLLDIAPETAVTRKSVDRDRYERDLSLQARVRDSYHRLAARDGWLLLDGERARDAVADDVFTNLASRLALQ